MSDKLEALKALADEIAPGYRQEWGCEDGDHDSISVGTYNDDGDICPFIEVSISDWSGNDDDNEKLAKFIALANPPVISELLAALEEKDQRIAELESQLQSGFTPETLAQEERAEKAEQESKELEESLGIANAATKAWKDRAKTAEQRLQQPIKLPDIRSEDYHETGWFQHMKYYRDVVRTIQASGQKVEGE